MKAIAKPLKKKITTMPPLMVQLGRYLPLLILSGLAVHLILPQIATLAHSWQVIQQMPWWIVLAALLAQVASYGGFGYLLRALVGITGQLLSVWRGMIIALAASSIGLVAGGIVGNAAATYRWLRSEGIDNEGAVMAGTLPSLFNNTLLALVAIVGLFHLLLVHELTSLEATSFTVILLLLMGVVGILVWSVRQRERMTQLAIRLTGFWLRIRQKGFEPELVEANLDRFFNTWDSLQDDGWQRPLLGATINISFDMLTLYFIFIAAGHTVSPGILLTGYGLPLLLGRVGFLPGGVGIVEGTMAALYASLSVPSAITVVVILTYRIISFWLPTLIGFPLILFLQKGIK